MDDLQRKIYALVVKTTVAMFLPDYLYEETKIQTKVADLLFSINRQDTKARRLENSFQTTNQRRRRGRSNVTLGYHWRTCRG